MVVSHKDLNGQHLANYFCRQGDEQNRRRLAEEEASSGTATAITAYGIPSPQLSPLSTLGDSYQRQMTTSQRWCEIYIGRKIIGCDCPGCLEGKAWMPGPR